ncbi:hypothetical protein F5X68DRAFT_195748 [Plectosphaerella plurivora]|uniref:Uncharacterized protein n=1 Tax=Plectosphaerella plurivora TaxID=936078 RepID=A0A9P9A529_9PEZI|nr:hypothetical protein F5X68DRAFT_195748 [Plectosphaerella plurivora]
MKMTLAFTLLFGFLATALAQQYDNRFIVMLQRASPSSTCIAPPQLTSPLQDSDIDAYLGKIKTAGDAEEVLRWHGASIFYGVVVRSLSHTVTTLGVYPEVVSVEPDQIVTIPTCSVQPCRKVDLYEEVDRHAAAQAALQTPPAIPQA